MKIFHLINQLQYSFRLCLDCILNQFNVIFMFKLYDFLSKPQNLFEQTQTSVQKYRFNQNRFVILLNVHLYIGCGNGIFDLFTIPIHKMVLCSCLSNAISLQIKTKSFHSHVISVLKWLRKLHRQRTSDRKNMFLFLIIVKQRFEHILGE